MTAPGRAGTQEAVEAPVRLTYSVANRGDDAGISGVPVSPRVRDLAYTTRMQQVTLELPDDLSAFLSASGRDLQQAVLEAIALEAYRENKLSIAQLRRALGYRTKMQVHGFLKEHGVYLPYGRTDLEHDRHAGDAIQVKPST